MPHVIAGQGVWVRIKKGGGGSLGQGKPHLVDWSTRDSVPSDSPHGLVDQGQRSQRLVDVERLGAGDPLHVAHFRVGAVLKHGTLMSRHCAGDDPGFDAFSG